MATPTEAQKEVKTLSSSTSVIFSPDSPVINKLKPAEEVKFQSVFSKDAYKLKVRLAGYSGVGKSSLISGYLLDKTLQSSLTMPKDKPMTFNFLGQQQFEFHFYEHVFAGERDENYYYADALALVVSITEADTAKDIKNKFIYYQLQYRIDDAAIKVLVANKNDKKNERKIEDQDLKSIAEKNGYLFVSTCASKAATGIDLICDAVAKRFLEKQLEEQNKKINTKPVQTPQDQSITCSIT
jgi:GTPase SAR1 family protein